MDIVTIRLAAMRFSASIGVLPEEREHRQPVEVDLSVRLASTAGARSNDGAAALDYRELYDIANDTFSGVHIELLEDAAIRIADRVMQYKVVAQCTVAVRKPEVPLPGPLRYSEVVLERTRDE